MTTEITMPQLGESVVEGTISKWLKQPGEHVAQYEPLLEVMTDKVDSEVPAPAAGVLREIVVPEGSTVRVGAVLALLDDAQEPAVIQGSGVSEESAAASPESPPHPLTPSLTPGAANGQRTFISPVVARMVAEHNLDLTQIEGTGAGGRVSKQDVLRYLSENEQTSKPQNQQTAEPANRRTSKPQNQQTVAPSTQHPVPNTQHPTLNIQEDADRIPVAPMRRAIAEHMVRSVRTAPHVTSVFEMDLSRVVAHRTRSKAEYERHSAKLTFTPYFVQAAVAALRAVPSVNASYADDDITMHQRIHVGVAVALDEGLIVPVIHNADEKNLLGLARTVNDLASRARARKLKADETQGGTFTITNHGVGGSLFATPIISQPQAAIMGVGAIEKRVVVVTHDGVDSIAIRPMCYVSLTIDHRLLDGAVADQFLTVVKRFLEGYNGT